VDKRSLVMYLSGLVAAGAVVGLAASCSDQPRIKCTAGHGAFAAVYSGGDPNCTPKGEEIGVEAYNYPLADNSNVDPRRGSLGMAALDLAAAVAARNPTPDPGQPVEIDTDTTHKPFSLGDWLSAEPGPDEFCTVKDPNPTEQRLPFVEAKPPTMPLPDGGGGTPAKLAYYRKYEWSNVRFYNTPALPGTQLVADLTYTAADGTADGGVGTPCTSTVRVVGLWPSVHCESDDPMTMGPIDESKCSPEADNSKGRPTGSGINPDLKTKCDPDLKLCVLLSEPR
jgi:hypothetical protein